jgi:hypothetical protein
LKRARLEKKLFNKIIKGRKIHPIGKEIILISFPLGWKSEK